MITKQDIDTMKDEKKRLFEFFESDALIKMQNDMILDEKLKCEKNLNDKKDKIIKSKISSKYNRKDNSNNECDDDTLSSDSEDLSLELDDDGNPRIFSDDEKRDRKMKKKKKIETLDSEIVEEN